MYMGTIILHALSYACILSQNCCKSSERAFHSDLKVTKKLPTENAVLILPLFISQVRALHFLLRHKIGN